MSLWRTKSIEFLEEEANSGAQKLERSLGAFNLVLLGIGAIIGAGLFSITGIAAVQNAGPAVIISFILASIGCAFAGLCFSELASMIPVAGGAYSYTYVTLGEFIAWIIGWALMLEYAAGAAVVSISWSAYMISFLQGFNIELPAALVASPWQPTHLIDGTEVYGWINFPALLVVVQKERAQQLKEPLPETDEKVEHRKNIAEKEKEILKQIGLKSLLRFDHLEKPTHLSLCLATLGESEASRINPTHQLDASHKELLDDLFERDLMEKMENIGSHLNIRNFEDFEKSVKATSLVNAISSKSNPEVGAFLHLTEIDPYLVRSYDKKIVTSCIDKYIKSLVHGLDIPSVDTLAKEVGKKISREQVKKLTAKYRHLQTYILSILGVGLNALQTEDQINKKWGDIRKQLQMPVDAVRGEFNLSSWVKVLMGDIIKRIYISHIPQVIRKVVIINRL